MNSLTVNLHLMMVSFYRPTPQRHAIVIEDSAFPSDSYAVRSQAAFHGYDPDTAVIRLRPRDGESRCAARTSSRSSPPRAAGSRSCCSARSTTTAASSWTSRRSPPPGTRRARSSVGTSRTPRATCRCGCTTGTSTGRRGVRTSTSTAGRGRSPARSCTSGTWPTVRCRSSPAGGAPTRPPASRWRRPSHPVDTRGLVAAVQPADPRHGAGAGLARDVRRGRHGRAAGQEHPAHRLPRVAARHDRRRPSAGGHHAARPAAPRRATVGAHPRPGRRRGQRAVAPRRTA